MTSTPRLSIVVTIVDGGPYLRDFLRAATAFDAPPSHELIVPFDASIPETAALRDEFPGVNFLDLGFITPIRSIRTEAGLHELYDRRRAAGLAAARGDIIAILEDRGHPRADWARTVVRLHEETRNNVIGGAIECQEPASLLNWAFYVTDFGRFGRPFQSGAAAWVSDVNVTYSRAALEEVRHLWQERFHEPLVHAFFLDRGEELYLSSDLVVEHTRPPATLAYLVPERFHWGQLFGYIRSMQFTPRQRILFSLASPLIPPVLWVRHGMIQWKKGNGWRYLRALPLVMILTTSWTLGEVRGYVTRQP